MILDDEWAAEIGLGEKIVETKKIIQIHWQSIRFVQTPSGTESSVREVREVQGHTLSEAPSLKHKHEAVVTTQSGMLSRMWNVYGRRTWAGRVVQVQGRDWLGRVRILLERSAPSELSASPGKSINRHSFNY